VKKTLFCVGGESNMYEIILCIIVNNCVLLWILRHFFDRYVEMEAQKHSLQSQLSILKLKITSVEDMLTDAHANVQKTFALLKRMQYKMCSGDSFSPLPSKSAGEPYSPLSLKTMCSFDMPVLHEKRLPS
jgi:hypothetical protein